MLNLTKALYLKLILFVLILPYQSNAISSINPTDKPFYKSYKIVNSESYILEAEDYFEIVADPRSREIQRFGAGTASNGNVVAIFDRGDKIKIPFTVDGAQPVKYIVKVRVRSGNVNTATRYWPDGYLFDLDGEAVTLTGDDSSLSAFTGNLGGSYWGDMVSDTLFSNARDHFIETTANLDWAAVDYLEVVVFSGSTTTPVDDLPIVDAGNAQEITLPTDSVSLMGSGSDPDGGAVTYLWTKLSGPSATIQNAGSATTKVSNLVEGTYTFNLQVTDDENNEVNDQVTITVRGATTIDELPIVDAGDAKEITLPTDIVTLMGSGSDPDGGSVTYLWTKLSGPSAVIQNAGSVTTNVSNLVEGIYTFNLRVTDDEGNAVNDQVTVTVNPEENTGGGAPTTASSTLYEAEDNYEIVADLGSREIQRFGAGTASNGNVVAIFDRGDKIKIPFTVEGVQPVKYIVKVRVRSGNVNTATRYWPDGYLFDLDGEAVTLTGDESSLSAFTGNLGGSYWGDMVSDTLVSMTEGHSIEVTANSNWTAVDYLEVIVFSGSTTTPVDELPIVDAGNAQEITLPTDSVSLMGSGSDPDGGSVTYLWTKLSGPSATIQNAGSATTKVSNLLEGTYTFNLRITDDENNEANDQVSITVRGATTIDELPIVDAGDAKEITLPTDSVTLMGSGSDPDGGSVTYLWTKLSGPSATIQNTGSATTKVSNLVEGTYTFNLLVTDDENNEVNDQVSITVRGATTIDELPIVDAGDAKEITLPTDSVTLMGSGSDPDGGSVTYLWTKPSGSSATIQDAGSANAKVSNLLEGTYTFNLRVTDDENNEVNDQVTVTVNPEENTGGGTPTIATGTLYEAEDNYEIVFDPSSRDIGRFGAGTASNGNVVAIFDRRDKIKIPFTVDGAQPVKYIVKVRVRSGNINTATRYWPGGYLFDLDGAPITLTGDPSSLSGFTNNLGGAYWGDMVSDTLLSNTSEHFIEITSNLDWAAVDYLEVVVFSGSTTTPIDELPIANAGNDIEITLPTNSVTLIGSGNDPDGGAVTYLWSQQSGNFAIIQNEDSASTKINGLLVQGEYTFNLKVTDDENNEVNDQVTITVLEEESNCEGDIRLRSQAEVDNFNCDIVSGNLIIDGSDITDLSNLNTLSSISGGLVIRWTSLTDLRGLVSLSAVGDSIIIRNNDALQSILGLQNIKDFNGDFAIISNSTLTSINNFPDITEVQTLEVINNNQLTSLNGVQSLSIIYQNLVISDNARLTNISDLSNVISLAGNDLDVEITNNALLESCCFNVALITDAGGTVTIANNAEGCNSVEEISISCASEPFVEMTIPGLENKEIIDLKWGDMNNDGYKEIVLIEQLEMDGGSTPGTYEISVYQLENDTYTKIQNSTTTFIGYGSRGADLEFLIDYNNDGWLDILFTKQFPFAFDVNILSNNQDGSYAESTIFDETGFGGPREYIDIDRDGDLDIPISYGAEFGSTFTYLKNNLYNSYSIDPTPRVNYLRTVNQNLKDYDGDGDLDVMINSNDYFQEEGIKEGIFIFKNNTQGSFDEILDIESNTLYGSWQDIDFDGDYDVLASTFSFSTIRKYENLGSDNFTETSKEILEAGGYDFNHDGIADKLVNGFPNYILKKGDSNGNLSDFLTLPDRVAAGWADFDRDGDRDIYTSDGRVFVNTVVDPKVDQAPGIPANLDAVTDGNNVTFSWDKPTDDISNQNALTYNIEVRKGGQLFTNAEADIIPKFTLNGLEEGTYSWKVQAMDKGLNASEYSPEQSFEISYDSTSCLISSVELGEPYDCSFGTYRRDVTISFTNNPNGKILVNNTLFGVTSNPLKVTLTNIPANGEAVDLSIEFENNSACSYFQEDAFTSPSGCNCYSYSKVFLTTQAEVDNFDCTNNTGGIFIRGNDITNLNGLSELISTQGSIEIRDNPNLSSLEGLDALTSVNSIYIVNNAILDDVSALQTVETINGSLIVNNNPQLGDCCILEDLISKASATISINNNAAGCSSTTDIVNACNETLFSERIEVEDNYTVLNDPGNFTLEDENNAAFSGRGTLLMWDKQDQARITFNIPKTSNYRLKVHLRSGDASSSSNYFNTYTFYINNIEIPFTGDNSTIIHYPSQYGNSYFGTIESPLINLLAGTYTLDILANAPWSIIDYVEIIEEDGSSSRFASELVRIETVTENAKEFVIYPNPSNGEIFVNFKTEKNLSELYLNIMDVTGKSVYQKNYNTLVSEKIDLSHFPKGIFIVTIKSELGIETKKVVLK